MSQPTGNYDYPCTWYVYSLANPDARGAQGEQYTGNGTLWADISSFSSNLDTELEGRRETVRVTVRVRGWVNNLKNLDRLHENQFGRTFVIESLYIDRENYETVCSCWLWDGSSPTSTDAPRR